MQGKGINQKYLRKAGLIALVTVLGMTPPLSTDMYMPSLPKMAVYFHAIPALVNMTMVAFFISMAIGMLIMGPLSDRSGRKKILIISLALYMLASIGCAVTASVYLLILMRIIQGLGAGGMVSLSIAIIKDCFEGQTRATALAVVQSMSVIAPIAAPVIGALIIQVSTWRTVFIVLAAISAACLLATFLFEESIHEDERNEGGVVDSFKRIAVVSRNRNFSAFLLTVSFYSAPFMAYLAVASYIYEDYFGLLPTTFSIFFAINALSSVFGPLIYMKVNSRVSIRATMNVLIIAGLASAAAMLLIGNISPVVFLATMIPFSIVNSYMRPFSTNILLDQVKGDTGSASALLNFMHTLLGSIGMFIGSLPWSSYIGGVGITMIGFILIALVLWIITARITSLK
ncbi:MAG: multidrug effflux MFS transporter [Bacillota bacterium]|nr:multidrug effflux MFS transporter [Bacillota bacterium]